MYKYSDDPEHLCGCGLDIGGTLTKIAVARPGEELVLAFLKNYSCQEVLEHVMDLGVQFCGVTGSGAADLRHKARLYADQGRETPKVFCVNEFVAWGAGASKLLPGSCGVELPYILGSVGTGTSLLLVNGVSITRIGGSALGGGTILGLGRALVPGSSFEDVCRLAADGKRSGVDLLLKDIYAPGQVGIADNITASNFGRLAGDREIARPSNADIMAGIIGMVGENIALIASGMMNLYRTHTIVYAGSTLRNNFVLRKSLLRAGALLNHKAVILERGEFSGAVGAYQLGLSNWSLSHF
ncbi:MAG: hypothetical protein ACI38Q_08620 [Candidatus Bruticola sp.]